MRLLANTKKLNIALSGVLILGAVLWNGWVFGWLNHGLAGYLHMSISELEAVGQSHAALFNILEDVSGLFMIIGALGLIVIKKLGLSLLSLILLTIAIIGGLTLYDVAHPLDCNTYQNPACSAKIAAGQVSHRQLQHVAESNITAYVTILLALLVVAWAYAAKLSASDCWLVALLAIGVIITLIILDTSNNVTLNAVSERLWNVLVSVDIGLIALRHAKLGRLAKL